MFTYIAILIVSFYIGYAIRAGHVTYNEYPTGKNFLIGFAHGFLLLPMRIGIAVLGWLTRMSEDLERNKDRPADTEEIDDPILVRFNYKDGSGDTERFKNKAEFVNYLRERNEVIVDWKQIP